MGRITAGHRSYVAAHTLIAVHTHIAIDPTRRLSLLSRDRIRAKDWMLKGEASQYMLLGNRLRTIQS